MPPTVIAMRKGRKPNEMIPDKSDASIKNGIWFIHHRFNGHF